MIADTSVEGTLRLTIAEQDDEIQRLKNRVRDLESMASLKRTGDILKRTDSILAQLKPMAPAKYIGMQEGDGKTKAFPLYNLTEAIPGHPVRSTVSRDTLEKAGFRAPAAEFTLSEWDQMRFEAADKAVGCNL